MVDALRVSTVAAPPVPLRIDAPSLDDFRLMLREQLVDDTERLRDIEAGLDSTPRAAVQRRIDLVWSLATQVGGLY